MKFDEAGTYKLEYTATDGCGNTTTEDRLVTVTPPPYYSAIWDGSSNSAWTRADLAADFPDPNPAVANGTGSSPFDDIMPWSGMQIVEDAEAGTLVSIPKYWYKWTRDGASMKLSIANEPQDGFVVSPAHADRGDGVGERDIVYVGRYHCSSVDYKSATGITPKVSTTRADFRTAIHNLGTDIWQYDFAMYWTICMLYLVEYADWNSQAKIGYGCGTSSSVANEGATDAMVYHTGTNAADRTTYGEVQYRYIEGLWSNGRDFVDGIYFDNTDVYCIKNPADFSDTTGGTLVGTRANAHNEISAFFEPSSSGFEYALYPSATVSNNNWNTYVCDMCGFHASGVVLYVGGTYKGHWQRFGLFFLYGCDNASISQDDIGSRLMKLPND